MGRRRRQRVDPTHEWEQIELLCAWEEQRDYKLIRPLVLFGVPADGRSEETGTSSGRTLRRKAARFEAEGMESLFGSDAARRRRLPPAVRRLVVDLKAEHPALNPNEISRVCYVRFGRRPARKTVKRVLAEEPMPLRFVRRFPPYHQIPGRRDARAAVVALHAEGWSAKAISGYLRAGLLMNPAKHGRRRGGEVRHDAGPPEAQARRPRVGAAATMGRMRLGVRGVMYADAVLNLTVMVAILLGAPALAEALRLSSVLPIVGLAALIGLGAGFHWATGRTRSRGAVRVMILMDGSVLLVSLLLAVLDPLDAPAGVRGLLVLAGMLAFAMGALKVVALRVAPTDEVGRV